MGASGVGAGGSPPVRFGKSSPLSTSTAAAWPTASTPNPECRRLPSSASYLHLPANLNIRTLSALLRAHSLHFIPSGTVRCVGKHNLKRRERTMRRFIAPALLVVLLLGSVATAQPYANSSVVTVKN